jgi:polar amino acid transport system substrate-binding protein
MGVRQRAGGAWYLCDMDRRQLLSLAAALAGSAPFAGAVEAKPLRIVTASFPPLSIEADGERPGALTELVKELCKRIQQAPAIEFLPWPRAILMATTLPQVAIYPLTRLPMRENNFRWLAPLFEENYVFLAPRRGQFDVQHPQQMQSRRIALIRGGTQGAILKEWGFHHLVEAKSVQEVHRFLMAGMADAAFGERNIIRTSLKKQAAEQDFMVSEPLRSTTAWLAGSLDFTDADANVYKRAMEAMVADGSYRRILAKYELG